MMRWIHLSVLLALLAPTAYAEERRNNLTAKEILERMERAYVSLDSLRAKGHLVNSTPDNPMESEGEVSITFARPDNFRIDWTRPKYGAPGMLSVTSSIFQKDRVPYFYWAERQM